MPTTDARTASIPLPLGGPKGSGLALLIECLASLLAGLLFCAFVVPQHSYPLLGIGMLFGKFR